jgi:hypothetical protein
MVRPVALLCGSILRFYMLYVGTCCPIVCIRLFRGVAGCFENDGIAFEKG